MLNIRFKKKVVLCVCAGLIGVAAVCWPGWNLTSTVIGNREAGGDSLTLRQKQIAASSWAFRNEGQTVGSKKGQRGADINIIPFWNKRAKLSARSSQSEKPELPAVRLAVVDTGLYNEDGHLSDYLWRNHGETPGDGADNDRNGFADDVNGWDFCGYSGRLYSLYAHDYHGTYIANEIVRVNERVKLICCKFMEGTHGSRKDALSAMQYAVDQGAKIVNCSWFFDQDSPQIRNLIRKNKDVLFVCAAGNSSVNLDKTNLFPAGYDDENVITVGAVDNRGRRYGFGGYGKKTVDIMAPGESVPVIFPEGDREYTDGTSIATAYVSGAASILLGLDSSLRPAEIRTIIINSARKMKSLKDVCVSGGMLDIAAAVEEAGSRGARSVTGVDQQKKE